MSKKAKRQTRKAAPVSNTMPSSGGTTPQAVLEVPRSSVRTEREFNPDYSYVIKDLKRIGTLAGIFIAVLIILSFII